MHRNFGIRSTSDRSWNDPEGDRDPVIAWVLIAGAVVAIVLFGIFA